MKTPIKLTRVFCILTFIWTLSSCSDNNDAGNLKIDITPEKPLVITAKSPPRTICSNDQELTAPWMQFIMRLETYSEQYFIYITSVAIFVENISTGEKSKHDDFQLPKDRNYYFIFPPRSSVSNSNSQLIGICLHGLSRNNESDGGEDEDEDNDEDDDFDEDESLFYSVEVKFAGWYSEGQDGAPIANFKQEFSFFAEN